MTKQQRKLIDEVLDNFDFDKVKKAMDALNWIWIGCDGVPAIYDLRKQSRRLLKDAIEKNLSLVSTGGFRAGYNDNILSLDFIVTEWYEDLESLKIKQL